MAIYYCIFLSVDITVIYTLVILFKEVFKNKKLMNVFLNIYYGSIFIILIIYSVLNIFLLKKLQ